MIAILQEQVQKAGTGGPRYSRTFYLRIRLFTFQNWSKMTIFQSKMDFLSANSRFAVKNVRTYLPRITRETCIIIAAMTVECTFAMGDHLNYPNVFNTLWSNNPYYRYAEVNSLILTQKVWISEAASTDCELVLVVNYVR